MIAKHNANKKINPSAHWNVKMLCHTTITEMQFAQALSERPHH